MKMKISLTVCDVCEGRDEPAKTWKVQGDGMTATVDLCEEHGAPLLELVRAGGGTKPPKTRRRRTGSKVTTLEEIESKKAQRT